MLLPEPSLATLIEQLRTLPAGDRRAILARLDAGERRRVRAGLRGIADTPVRPASPFSDPIAARIAAGADAPMTEAGRAALRGAVAAMRGPERRAQESLADALGGLFRTRGRT